jgi:hypothetical protein
MKKHKILVPALFGALFFLVSGCGIFSLHPLYLKADLIIDIKIIGTWHNQQEDENLYFIIDTLKDNKYEFVVIDDKDTLEFEMGLLRLNGQYFIDLFPNTDCSFFDSGNCVSLENFVRNYIPAHTFMKLDVKQGAIVLTEFDNERLLDLFKQNRIRLPHEQPEDMDYVVITAGTDELQKFISRYAADPDAFNDPATYYRVKS